jgi:hypothetical protein
MSKRGKKRGDTMRIAEMEAFKLHTLPLDFKQVELFKKFLSFFTPKFWEATCPKPSDEALTEDKSSCSKNQ